MLTSRGSIPKRRELVKEAARNRTSAELKETRKEQQGHLWSVDTLSQRPLTQPVVSDALGRLFNKDSVIEYLLPSEDADNGKRTEQEALVAGAFKSLKDLVEVKFEVEDAEDGSRSKNEIGRTEDWICPVTRQELGPGSKAVYLVPCGHAFSGSAAKEISGELCLQVRDYKASLDQTFPANLNRQCNTPYASNDIIPILSIIEEDIARLSLRQRTLKENGLTHSLKKASGSSKKRKRAATVEEALAAMPLVDIGKEDGKAETEASSSRAPLKSIKDHAEAIKNSSTASLTVKVLQEQEEKNKRRKNERNENLESLFSKKNHDRNAKERDIGFMNRGFAIPGRK